MNVTLRCVETSDYRLKKFLRVRGAFCNKWLKRISNQRNRRCVKSDKDLCNFLFEVGGPRWRSWLRHCATSQKVAGSIPDGVTGIFH